jgi:EAL domain-containing protein (putative c-di-GMP-specific phosphodiesterase class I)
VSPPRILIVEDEAVIRYDIRQQLQALGYVVAGEAVSGPEAVFLTGRLCPDLQQVIAKMRNIKAMGVSFSLDDFGTGDSSLTHLKRLPMDQLKIDQSFVRDLLTDPDDALICQTIVALGHNPGMQVIAEGVETTGQRDYLAGIGCDAFQGDLFARPLPPEALAPAQSYMENRPVALMK